MAKRGKSQARRSGANGTPGWVWLVVGVLLGAALSAGLLLKDRFTLGASGPRPDPNAAAPKPSEEPVAQRPSQPAKPKYDFYTLLPEREVAIPDQELAAKARSEAPATPDATPAPATERYQLQAGAFREARDAEALKARLALMGLSARVQSDRINDAVFHRVRLGPYTSARDLEAAKRQLADNGINAVAIREQVQ